MLGDLFSSSSSSSFSQSSYCLSVCVLRNGRRQLESFFHLCLYINRNIKDIQETSEIYFKKKYVCVIYSKTRTSEFAILICGDEINYI